MKITASKCVSSWILTGSGANTGFGGSAETRTDRLIDIQKALLQLTQTGVLTEHDKIDRPQVCYSQDPVNHSMPPAWVKAMMLVRCNATIRGHSGVSMEAVDAILELLNNDLIPIVPLKGTVSASGDLMPLAYIAGTIEGNPDVFVRAGPKLGDRIVTANEALNMAGIRPFTLGPNEGLGLVNGTAASTALASLTLYETHLLAILAQALTAVAVEALQGNAESFHPFIAQVRPHDGQIEAARNILTCLQGSQLAQGVLSGKDRNKAGLIQDRYALRSATQWIGPQLEDLLLADRQIGVELNSSADNPLIDVVQEEVLYGANFQAAAATSAMEKSRLCLQMFGKLLFSQTSEMIDPHLNNGLPPNLAADNPNHSFTMKGVDINMAAYMSELAFLSGPVSAHVQAAEMHNQSINSLAFVSGRYTMQAVELVSLMCASSLYVGCQALDLRVMHLSFLRKVKPVIERTTNNVLVANVPPKDNDELNSKLWSQISTAWWLTSTLDVQTRCQKVTDLAIPLILASLLRKNEANSGSACSLEQLDTWRQQVASALEETYQASSAEFFRHQDTATFLGEGSKALYLAVRQDLGVPFHQGFVEHPTVKDKPVNCIPDREKKTIGSWISIIYEAIRRGHFQNLIVNLLQKS